MTSKTMMIVAAYLHVLGVAAYVGGAIVMEFVLTPAQKFIPPAQAMVMGQKAADRFLWIAWVALGLIVASGILRLYTVGSEEILTSGLLDGQYGRTLFAMIVFWGVLVVNGAIMTFVLRPRLTEKMQGGGGAPQAQARQDEAQRAATWLTRLTRIDLVIALLVAFFGASLGFGGVL